METSTEQLIEWVKNDDTEALNKIFTHSKGPTFDWVKIEKSIKNYQNSWSLLLQGHINDNIYSDSIKAFHYFQLSANQNNPIAQNELGYRYREGIGIDKDIDKSFHYTKLSVDQGCAWGLACMGYNYYYGIGVERNIEEALYYYQLAADQGHTNAKNWIERICREHNIEPQFPKTKSAAKA